MVRITILLSCAVMLLGSPIQSVIAMDDPLALTLAKLDAASAKFSTAQADLEWDTYQKIVDDTEKQYGVIWFKRVGGSPEMRADVSDTAGSKPGQMIVYQQGKLQEYEPKIDDVKVIAAAKYESFLTLGFGGSGNDLKKNWNITYLGTEPMQGITVTKLDLKPIGPDVSKYFTHITIWVDADRGVSLQQKFFYPSGDYRTVFYSNIRYDKNIDSKEFKLPLTNKTKIENIQ
jgi:outer membrane lipoprotein-sorting protein